MSLNFNLANSLQDSTRTQGLKGILASQKAQAASTASTGVTGSLFAKKAASTSSATASTNKSDMELVDKMRLAKNAFAELTKLFNKKTASS